MPFSTLLTLVDDLASALDDVAAMTKIAVKKTSGVLGDDLALNAEQVAGVHAERELPVVWAVTKGSFRNKAILVPVAVLISAVAPWLVQPLLMAGGAYLTFEGAEKVAHKLLGRHEHVAPQAQAVGEDELPRVEAEKIRGAIRTDFVLSAEIIVIALGTVAHAPFEKRLSVVVAIALIMTVGVYGLVAAIVKLDDAALYLTQTHGTFAQTLGRMILRVAPWLMRGLGIVGTVAMFLVGGGIFVHGIEPLHHLIEALSTATRPLSGEVVRTVLNGLVGLCAGAALVACVEASRWFRKRST
jgi:predicted DNA repair protein MutK